MTDLLYDTRRLTDRTALDSNYSKTGTIDVTETTPFGGN